VVLEELAQHFKLRTEQAISRVRDMEEAGYITGVMDDRGKFIYISEEEMESVAKYINKKGRVTIADLGAGIAREKLIVMKDTAETD
jgi:CTP-dependent riboflavin kinase